MPTRTTVNVSLTPELDRFVEAQVASGRYQSASEVFREGLRLLEQAEQRRLLEKWLLEGLTAEEESRIPPKVLNKAQAWLRAQVQEGLDSLERGEKIDGEEYFAQWRSRLKRAADSKREPSRVKRGA